MPSDEIHERHRRFSEEVASDARLVRLQDAQDAFRVARFELRSALLDGYLGGVKPSFLAKVAGMSEGNVMNEIRNEKAHRKNVARQAERKAQDRAALEVEAAGR